MKRFLTFLMAIVLLVTSMLTSSVSVLAEDDVNVDEEVTETNVLQDEESEDDEEIVIVEESSEETDDPTLTEETEETEDEETEDEEIEEIEEVEGVEAVEDEVLLIEDDELEEEKIYVEADNAISKPSDWKFKKSGGNLAIGSDSWNAAEQEAWTKKGHSGKNSKFKFYLGDTLIKEYSVGGRTGSSDVYFDVFFFAGHSGSFQIDTRQLIDDKFMSNTTYRIVVEFDGCNPYEENVNISQLIGKDLCLPAPNDISVAFDDDGNLVITSSNTDWLAGLAKVCYEYTSTEKDSGYGYVPERTVHFGGGYISVDGVKLQNTGKKKVNNVGTTVSTNIVFSYDSGNTLTIPATLLDGITGDSHSFELSSEGYELYYHEQTVSVDEDVVEVSVDNDGDLVIECKDNSIKQDYIGNLDTNKDNRATYVTITDSNGVTKQFTESDVYEENGNAVISSDTIKSTFDYQITGNVTINVKSKGYDLVTRPLDLPYISVGAGSDGSKVVLNVGATFKAPAGANWNVQMKVNGSYGPTETDKVEYSVNSNGLTLTAKSVDVQTVKVTATTNGISDTLELMVTADGLKVTAAKKTDTTYIGAENAKMIANAYINDEPLPASVLSYSSSNEAVATVDSDGTLTPLSSGKTTITAYVGDVSATTEYTVYKYSQKEGLVVSPASINKIEVGEEMTITATVDGKPVDVSDLTFKSSSKSVADTEENVVKAIKKGSAKITVSLKEDGAKEKKATVAVNVIDRECNDLVLSIGSKSETAEFYDDVVGSKMNIVATATDMKGEDFTIKTVKYVSSDSSVVAVSSSGEVTFKKAGSATITGTVTSNPKEHPVSATLSITILDFMPRLSQNQLYVNPYTKSSGSFMIVEAYKDHPDRLTFEADDISITGGYQIEEIAPETYKLIVPNTPIKTRNEVLKIVTNEGPIYEFDVKVIVNTKKPFVKYKAYGLLNTFTGENTLEIHGDSSLGRVESVTADWFDADWYRWEDWWPLLEARSIVLKDLNVKSGDIFAKIEGYEEPVKSRVSFKVVNTKPKIKLSASSVSIYVPDGDTTTKNISVQFEAPSNYYNTPSTIIVNGLGYVDEEFTSEWGSLVLPIDPTKFDKSGTLTLSYKKDGWTGTVDNKLKVKKINKLPKVSLKSSSVKLNQLYNGGIGIQAIVSGNNDLGLELLPMTVEPQGLNVADISGSNYLYVRLNDTGKTAAPGKYLYTLTPNFSNGEKGDPIKFTVEIYNKAATMSVSVKGEVNPINSGEYKNVIEGKIKLSNVNGNDFLPISVDSEYFELTSSTAYNGVFSLKLKDDSVPDGTYEVPVKVTLDNGDELVKNIKAKVKRKAPKVGRQASFEIFDTTNNETNVGSGYIYPSDFAAMTSEDKISVVADKNDGAFRFDVVSIDEYGGIEYNIVLADGSKVKAGSKTTLTVTIKWEGDDGKPKYRTSTYKISISDISNKIKKKK